jgi:hypothetical protein
MGFDDPRLGPDEPDDPSTDEEEGGDADVDDEEEEYEYDEDDEDDFDLDPIYEDDPGSEYP